MLHPLGRTICSQSGVASAPMMGLMGRQELLTSTLLDHVEEVHPEAKVVTRTTEGPVVTHSWAEIATRSRQIGSALTDSLGLEGSDVVGTLAWNNHRHLELYYGTQNMGLVLNTINPRLFADQIGYIINHAQNKALFVDSTFLPLVQALGDILPDSLETIIPMTDASHAPAQDSDFAKAMGGRNIVPYEDLLAEGKKDFAWPSFSEDRAACLCYTSGTTGTFPFPPRPHPVPIASSPSHHPAQNNMREQNLTNHLSPLPHSSTPPIDMHMKR